MAKLKVFRTPIGFHDAYVAAPSRKAALRAWGSEKDLFARGVAEEVTDPALTKAPLERPGEVVKVSRGTAAEQWAALPPGEPKAKRVTKASAKPKPKSSRKALDAAEAKVDAAKTRHADERAKLEAEERTLAKRRQQIEAAQREERETLEARRDAAEADYETALAAWREG